MNDAPKSGETKLHPGDWIEFIEREYLASFVRDGGATIKFVVPSCGEDRDSVCREFLRRARNLGYVAARINAEDTRVQKVEELFFRVAQAVDWKGISERVVLKMSRELNYQAPHEGGDPLLVRIAAANHLEPAMVQLELRSRIQSHVFFKRRYAKDFRVAMTHLCLAALSGQAEAEKQTQILSDWLTGRNRLISPVKPYQIHCRINRANARFFFESLLRWVRFAGMPGVAILLDITRLAVKRNPKDGAYFYSKSAMKDAYEILRQFVDSTDQLEGCFMLVVADVAFLDPELSERGYGAYKALMTRVVDDVRDRRLVNPMTSLVRLSSSAKRVLL